MGTCTFLVKTFEFCAEDVTVNSSHKELVPASVDIMFTGLGKALSS